MRSLSTVCAAAIAAVWAGTACPGESPGAEAERLARLVAAEAARTPPSVLLPHYKFMAEHARDESVRREAAWHLARVCIALGRRDEAGKLLDELSSRVDDRWGRAGALRLGELYREQKQPERAIEAFERILGKNLIVPEAVRAAAAFSPAYGGVYRLQEEVEVEERLPNGKVVKRKVWRDRPAQFGCPAPTQANNHEDWTRDGSNWIE